MKLSDLVDILSQANLPIAYRAFETGHVPQTPYLIYFESHPDIKRADDEQEYQIKSVTVELIFERKDEDLEETLEDLLSKHQLVFEVSEESYIPTERLSVKPYTVYLY